MFRAFAFCIFGKIPAMKSIQRSQLVTIKVPKGATLGAKFFLPDIPELRDALIDGLETYTEAELAADLNGVPTVQDPGLAGLTLSLIQESDRRAMDIPAWSLRSSQYGGIWKEFDSWRVNWQKCYLQVVDPTNFIASDRSFALNVFYHYGRR